MVVFAPLAGIQLLTILAMVAADRAPTSFPHIPPKITKCLNGGLQMYNIPCLWFVHINRRDGALSPNYLLFD